MRALQDEGVPAQAGPRSHWAPAVWAAATFLAPQAWVPGTRGCHASVLSAPKSFHVDPEWLQPPRSTCLLGSVGREETRGRLLWGTSVLGSTELECQDDQSGTKWGPRLASHCCPQGCEWQPAGLGYEGLRASLESRS